MLLRISIIAILVAAGCTDGEDLDRRSSKSALLDSSDATEDCKGFDLRNGDEVLGSASELRYQAVGRLRVELPDNKIASCTATLIRNDVILTARHCIALDANQNSIEPATKITFELEKFPGRKQAASVFVKPGAYADVAVVSLTSAYPLSIEPFSYYDQTAVPLTKNQEVEIVGYGVYVDSTKPAGGSTSGVKRYGKMKYDADVSQSFGSGTATYHKLIPSTANQNSCQGDSGGPAIVLKNNVPTIVGVVSHLVFSGTQPTTSEAICRQATNANYTRLTDVFSWVTSTLAGIPKLNPADDLAPTIDDKTIEVTDIASNAVRLSWAKASDNVTTPSQLSYRVYYGSSNANFATVASIEADGVAANAATNDIGALLVSALAPVTAYKFSVIVTDLAGNKSNYTVATGTTIPAADDQAPIPGGLQAGVVGKTSVGLTWTGASDNETAAGQLTYQVFYSLEKNDFSSPTDALMQATSAGAGEAAMSETTVENLSSGKEYWFSVLVKDEAGNAALYDVLPVKTDSDKAAMTASASEDSDLDADSASTTKSGKAKKNSASKNPCQ